MKNKKNIKQVSNSPKNNQIIVQSLRENSHNEYTNYKNQKIWKK